MITTESGEKHTLPTEVREHATTKTSVYKAGTLVYDGATGEGVGRSNLEGPGQSLNEMLKWSIEQSDPSELARRAAEGAAPPSQIDREIMDMLLGQPTVAKMRECLGKLEAEALVVEGGLDAGAAALEELEYYAEDLDNAHDLVKIGGLAAMRRCCAIGLLAPDDPAAGATAAAEAAAVAGAPEEAAALREAACGVLAAMVQNNPKVAHAARNVGIPQLLLALLSGGGAGAEAERVGGIAVVRKALLALSALLRTAQPTAEEAAGERTLAAAAATATEGGGGAAGGEGGAADLFLLAMALPALCALVPHADLKVRRRTLFLLASLAEERELATGTIAAAVDDGMIRTLLSELSSEDEDVRTPTGRLLVAISGEGVAAADGVEACAALARRAASVGGEAVCEAALARVAAADAESVDPEEAGRLRLLAGRFKQHA